MNFELLVLAADSEVGGLRVQHDGLVEGRDGELACQRLRHLQFWLAPEQRVKTNKSDKT